MQNKKVLFSWEEIAVHLEISVSTLRKNWQLWGIPIKLLPTKKGYLKPFITLEKLKKWMDENPEIFFSKK